MSISALCKIQPKRRWKLTERDKIQELTEERVREIVREELVRDASDKREQKALIQRLKSTSAESR